MGGRDSCRDLRPHSRYRALFVDVELTSGVPAALTSPGLSLGSGYRYRSLTCALALSA
jgi:hypothetical protein